MQVDLAEPDCATRITHLLDEREADYAVYTATKAALSGFARSLREWQGQVTVQLVHPGATRTGMHEKMSISPEVMNWEKFPPADKVARMQGSQSDFGGYLDILVDFVVYAIIPIGLVLGQPSIAGFVTLALMLAVFYVNAASWMYLSAILEKRAAGAQAQGEQTSVTMPAGLIGGTETIILYSAFIILHHWYLWLFGLMTILVAITILQRLIWAARNLD